MITYPTTWVKIGLGVSCVCIYILPSYYFESINIPASSILLGLYLVLSLIIILSITTKLYLFEFVYFCFICLCCLYQKSINALVLLTPIVVFRIYDESVYDDIKDFLLHSRLVDLSLLCTIIYSIIYTPLTGRLLHTGMNEVNVSGLGVLLLGLIYLKRNKYAGYLVFAFGGLSLSRNYYLCLVLMSVFGFIRKRKNVIKRRSYHFFGILILSATILYLLGIIAQRKYNNGQIVYETTLLGRLTNLFDLSNYFRFTVYVIMVRVFIRKKIFCLFGCSTDEFKRLLRIYASENGFWYRGNNPHNFLFSYIKIFGIAGVMDIYMVGKLMNSIVNPQNQFIFYSLMLYPIFLSIGFNGEWLILVYSILLLYSETNGLRSAY